MKVKDLKTLLEGANDDLEVLIRIRADLDRDVPYFEPLSVKPGLEPDTADDVIVIEAV